MRRALPIRRLQVVVDVAVVGEQQPFPTLAGGRYTGTTLSASTTLPLSKNSKICTKIFLDSF